MISGYGALCSAGSRQPVDDNAETGRAGMIDMKYETWRVRRGGYSKELCVSVLPSSPDNVPIPHEPTQGSWQASFWLLPVLESR